MANIFWGIVIIAIGLVRGSSVFYGDFTFFNILFDALGVFWIVRGAMQWKAGKAESAA